MSKLGIIYAYTNLESGRMYIGQTIDPERRFKEHLTANYKQGWHIDYQNNPDKYEYSIIEMNVPEDKLDEREIYWISFFDTYNNGYNLNEGGGGIRGYRHTEETKKKMSDNNTGESNPFYGKHHTEESKKKMSESLAGKTAWNKGQKMSDEFTKKVSNSLIGNTRHLGKKHSEEAKKRMSEANKGKHWFNNGIINAYTYDCPEGFVKGKLTKKNN